MKKITNEELSKAFRFWRLKYPGLETEGFVAPYLSDQIKCFVSGEQSWLKLTRESLFLSAKTVSKKLKVSRAAYAKYEECELRGSVTLATLAKAAEAMDCELVYAIRPKNKKKYSEMIWKLLEEHAVLHPWIQACNPNRRSSALASVATNLMANAKFRKKMNWSQNS